MGKMIRAVIHTFRIIIVFVGCVLLFYYGMMWVNQEYENYRKYEEPEGAAIKVYKTIDIDQGQWIDRLLLFYQNGE